MNSAVDEPLFPYMFFARTEAFRSKYSLTQSGMPAADPKLLGETIAIDLSHAGSKSLPELESRVAAHLGVDRSQVLITLGASGAMHLAAAALFRPGVRVVSETPSYEPLRSLPRFFGADARLVERRPDAGWRIDPADVARALAGARTGHVFTTNPNNPTGAKSTAAEMAALAREAAKVGGVLLCCEVYMEYCLASKDRVHAFQVAPNTISMGSLTKAYGLGPLRIGWIVLGDELKSQRKHFEDVLYIDYVDAPTTTLALGVRAFDNLELLRRPIERMQREQKPVLAQWLASTSEVEGEVKELGLTAFPKIRGVADTRALHRHLVAEHEVDVVPGEFFGRAGHIRIGCGLEPKPLAEALDRLAAGVRSFQRRSS